MRASCKCCKYDFHRGLMSMATILTSKPLLQTLRNFSASLVKVNNKSFAIIIQVICLLMSLDFYPLLSTRLSSNRRLPPLPTYYSPWSATSKLTCAKQIRYIKEFYWSLQEVSGWFIQVLEWSKCLDSAQIFNILSPNLM